MGAVLPAPPQALWMLDPKDIGEWQHEEFYRFIAQAYDKPRYVLHYKTDAPLNIRSIFYVPEQVRVSCPGNVGHLSNCSERGEGESLGKGGRCGCREEYPVGWVSQGGWDTEP